LSDPVVHITNGVPDSGTGNITTLGAVVTALGTPMQNSGGSVAVSNLSGLALETGGNLATIAGAVSSAKVATKAASGDFADGSLVTAGAIADAAVAAGATGSLSAKLRAISRDLIANIVLAAGSAIIGKVGIDQTTPGTTNAVAATLVAGAGTAIGKVDPNTIGNWGLVVSTQNSATPTNSNLVSGQFNTAPTTITSGNVSPLQLDSSGNLLVNIKAGAGSGGTAIADEAAFTEGTTSFTPIGGVFKTSQTALTSGQAGAVALTAAREIMGLGKIWDGTTTLPILAASSGAPAATVPAIPVSIRDVNANGRAAAASSAPVVLSTEDNTLLGRLLPTATASGATASRINAAASTNATSLKASAGQIYTIDVFNAAAYNVFLKLYNKASAPTVGTDTPIMTIPIQAGGGFSKTWPMGLTFGTGIAYAITKLQADSDTTVLVASDLTGNTTWI
jgi:hypothetical protein